MIDNPDYERNRRYLYRFFANTSSVLRRSVWEQFPFPEVEFAEDQAWADQVLQAGCKTAYAADSVVSTPTVMGRGRTSVVTSSTR